MAGVRNLRLVVDSCNAELSAEIDERPTTVRVTVTARHDTNDDCLDGLVVHLERPLGDRRLLDGATGRPVTVHQDSP